MRNAQARTTYLKDYRPPAFTIETTDLVFDLYENKTLVVAKLLFKRNEESPDSETDTLVLHGRHMELERLFVRGKRLKSNQFLMDDDTLTIPELSFFVGRPVEQFTMEIHTRLEPQNNTALEGLYKSRKMFCTQCEAEGFRCITYYLDRPDVMSTFTTTIKADRDKYPVLLSNGNNIASGVDEKDASRHWVTWEDPFKKPAYLFALVAGDLVSLDDSFTTCNGRDIKLQIFVEEKDIDKCDHAMVSLKNAMRWDEEIYGREYDLDIFMIVAVDDFNMGAMENKGLNIFNTGCVLAEPNTTTDLAFQRVEAVVAHEYFHNWSGNRVTCRDWFQLSLKEGFTVFRDAEFSADMGSRTVKRVEDANFLKTIQFAEDAGPMAHSVRPDSYMEISNFYTVTIYEKGAEVVRMISLILGAENFRKGSDLYFDRHDGQAVTTEDFVKAMEDASGADLSQFRRWYGQAGTPVLNVTGEYDAQRSQYTLTVEQHCPDTPGQNDKQPFQIPLGVGLIDQRGEAVLLKLKDDPDAYEPAVDRVLNVVQLSQQFVFTGVVKKPVPSLLRSFSAPVRLNFDYSREELFFLMVHDSDGFNRWNAAQLLAIDVIHELQQCRLDGQPGDVPQILIDAYSGVLDSVLVPNELDKAMIAHLLVLPTEGSLIELAEIADVDAIHGVREAIANSLAARLVDKFTAVYEANCSDAPYQADAASIARRALKNLALAYLVRTGGDEWIEACNEQFVTASNMTDRMAALRCLVNAESDRGKELAALALQTFYEQWQHEPLVVDQWFVVQATCQLPHALDKVHQLLEHEAFDIRNPNKVRSLIGAFCGQNFTGFHAASGTGYEFLADRVLELDKLNPQIAARLLTPLTRWKKFDSGRQAMMQSQLQRIKAEAELSKDVFEVVEKSTAI
ncbi:MAG: aminopeptidase N [Gammaproteobacteria bacterium]|nr:aminopeptidase N [Gammaproteobacteria bacterium]MDP6731804.1 aminopeptidase N [Gammaproteobacteria bacterium]